MPCFVVLVAHYLLYSKDGSETKKKGHAQTSDRQAIKKKWCFFPLLPLIGALGAMGSLAGGASAIANAVNNAKTARKKLEEMIRHNKAMEAKGMPRRVSLHQNKYRRRPHRTNKKKKTN